MKVAVPTELRENERRVALTPDATGRLTGRGVEVLLQSGAGDRAALPDALYSDAGAQVAATEPDMLAAADLLVTVGIPDERWIAGLRPGSALIGLFQPLSNRDLVDRLAAAELTAWTRSPASPAPSRWMPCLHRQPSPATRRC